VLKNPGGWVNVDGRTHQVRDMIVGGLQGSMRYRPHVPYQYTEPEMAFKAWMMAPRLLANRLMRGRYLDIMITHSPPLGIHDAKDAAHRGFKTFVDMIERYRPRYLLHGHQHTYYGLDERCTRYLETEVINVHPYHVLEW
jgi:Icc-related predicted phosphoesterase